MENYTADILKASRNKETRLVFNKGSEHASVLMSTLFNGANVNVYIYSKMLHTDVTDNTKFLDSFEKILSSKNIDVKILLEGQTNNIKIIDLFNKYNVDFNNNIKILNDSNISNVKNHIKTVIGEDIHFTTVDDEAYRIEDNIIEYKAMANFNDTKLSKSLKNFFIDLYDNYAK